jgi:regulator of protease activity HflC (stomatin/prohibitin superfamily)
MADSDDNDDQGSTEPTGPGDRGRPKRGTSVTWRGIIDDPQPGDPPKHPRMAAVGGVLSATLVAVGLKRGHDDDGTLLPRKSGRLIAIVVTLFVVLLAVTMLHIVPAGNVLVPITLGDAQPQLPQGLHVTLPWPVTQVASMSIQTQNFTMTAANQKGTAPAVQVLGSDGASASVDATVLYKLDANQATKVFVNIGQSFSSKLVQPASISCIKSSFAAYKMIDAATTRSKQVSAGIVSCIKNAIEPQGVQLQQFQLRQVVLNSSVQSATNGVVAAQQNAVSQLYQIQIATAKAQITALIASGANDAAEIVACGYTTKSENLNGLPTVKVVPNPPTACVPPPLNDTENTNLYIQTLRDLINSSKPPVIILNNGGTAPSIQVPATTK